MIPLVQLNLPDVDAAFPEFLSALEALLQTAFEHTEAYEIGPYFDNVIKLAIPIFRREDEAMALCRDPMAVAHRTAHQRFLQSLSAFRKRYKDEGPSIPLAQDMRKDLHDWMRDHRNLMDANLGRLIKRVVDQSTSYHEGNSSVH
jgi:hemerythrin-like metal-binding protein